jgi:DNA topoisomerase-3
VVWLPFLFTLGLIVLERNYLDVYPFEKWSDSYLPPFQQGEQFQPTRLEMTAGKTCRPNLLTESDLIAIMDKSGIGTDATIHEHIKKILEREYANKEGDYFYPTTLGMALVKGYDEMHMNLSLSKPFLRSQMEASMKSICDGSRQKEEVVQETLQMYMEAFVAARAQAAILDENCEKYLGFEANPERVNFNFQIII